jgi:hypothetical protein
MTDVNLDNRIMEMLQSRPIGEWINVFFEARGVLGRADGIEKINNNLNQMRTMRRGSVNVSDTSKSPTK